MQTFVDCVYCYLKQAVNCMMVAGVDEEIQHRVLFELMEDIKALDRRKTPAENSSEIILKTYKLIENEDPYREIKTKSNALALELYPSLKEYVEHSANPLLEVLKISAAGNVIDLGLNRSYDLKASLEQCLKTGFTINDYELFQSRLEKSERDEVVILADNTGEIVFDRLLAEELSKRGKKVICIVKGGPIVNDATREDALQTGMEKTAQIMTTGSNYLGALLHKISPEARGVLERAEVIIAKGQANFETLEHEELARGRIFFLLKLKCEGVARVAGAKFGDVVFISRS